MLTDVEIQQFSEQLAALEECTTAQDLREQLASLQNRWLETEVSEVRLELLFGSLASFALPEVRGWVARAIPPHLPARWARDILCGLCVDPDDLVCMPAMRVAGVHDLRELAPYFLEIIGKPSQSIGTSVCPVGRGASIVRSSLIKLLGAPADDATALAAAEDNLGEPQSLRVPDHRWLSEQFDASAAATWLEERLAPADGSMVLIPGGLVEVGLDPEDVPSTDFAWERGVPRARIWLPPFLIDRTPVTNSAYDAWASDPRDHELCHAMEPEGRSHRRNTLLDDRLGPMNPVTGVDWLDAESFARTHHKTLPSEFQWEVAARGPDSSVWPWGEHWDTSRVWGFQQAFGSDPQSIAEWRRELERVVDRSWPAQSTATVDRPEVYVNGYGVADTSGNCWEWTGSELRTRGPFSPTIERFLDGTTSVVIKGGCWSSLPGQLYPSFRGQDAPFCRHDEIGFRCAINLPRALVRRFAGLEPTAPLPWYLY